MEDRPYKARVLVVRIYTMARKNNVNLSILSNLFHRPLPKFCVITIYNDEANANLVHYINQNLEIKNLESLTTMLISDTNVIIING